MSRRDTVRIHMALTYNQWAEVREAVGSALQLDHEDADRVAALSFANREITSGLQCFEDIERESEEASNAR
jgi:hypothetical protein